MSAGVAAATRPRRAKSASSRDRGGPEREAGRGREIGMSARSVRRSLASTTLDARSAECGPVQGSRPQLKTPGPRVTRRAKAGRKEWKAGRTGTASTPSALGGTAGQPGLRCRPGQGSPAARLSTEPSEVSANVNVPNATRPNPPAHLVFRCPPCRYPPSHFAAAVNGPPRRAASPARPSPHPTSPADRRPTRRDAAQAPGEKALARIGNGACSLPGRSPYRPALPLA